VREVAKTCQRPIIAALCRTTPEDIERAWEALSYAARPRIHTFLATSDIHLQYKLQKTREEVLEMACKAVRLAKGFTDDVEFSAEDATRSDLDYLCQVIAAVIDEGATVVNIPDTVGYTIPSEYTHIIETLKNRVPNIDRDDQRALPQRSGAGRRQLAGRRRRRSAPDRMHCQRHRRTRGQRVA
jgi:2-isopropylmalate synthase